MAAVASVFPLVRVGGARAPSASSLSPPRLRCLLRPSKRVLVRAGALNTDKDYNCVVNKEGVIIANDIPSGVYEVSAWWAGAHKEGEQPLAGSMGFRKCLFRFFKL